jgi:hypothetical protein
MLHPIAIAGLVAVVVVGVALLALRRMGQRVYKPKLAADQTAMWLTGTSAEEHRDYFRERAKNDRHQDLD